MAISKITAAGITSNVISSALIADGEITFTDIANNTITGAKIAATTITGDKIGLSAITGNLIAATTITGDKIGLNAITGNLIAATTITGDKIGLNAITGNLIASGITISSPTLTTPVIRSNVSVISTNTAAVVSTTYVLTANVTLTLPASPTTGDWIKVNNSSGTTTPVVARNGSNIQSSATDLTIDSANASFMLVYADATRGWVLSL